MKLSHYNTPRAGSTAPGTWESSQKWFSLLGVTVLCALSCTGEADTSSRAPCKGTQWGVGLQLGGKFPTADAGPEDGGQGRRPRDDAVPSLGDEENWAKKVKVRLGGAGRLAGPGGRVLGRSRSAPRGRASCCARTGSPGDTREGDPFTEDLCHAGACKGDERRNAGNGHGQEKRPSRRPTRKRSACP